jgi:hypothetical protein
MLEYYSFIPTPTPIPRQQPRDTASAAKMDRPPQQGLQLELQHPPPPLMFSMAAKFKVFILASFNEHYKIVVCRKIVVN